ncbi:MAG: hypothetical protein IKN65_03140 [Clostridia bacterium]|nr:hypothetical protein [Clostridia bacterium]
MFTKNKFLSVIKNNHSKIGTIMVLFFVISMFLFLYKNIYLMIDSDMSSELVLAKQLATEKKLITTNWYYSTELRVLNTQLVFMPLFMILANWNLVRTLGTLILVIILWLSFLYFAKGFKIKYSSYLSFLIVGSISLSYYSFVIIGAYYIPHIIISFFVLGLIARIMNNQKQKNIIRIIVLCLISLLAGMGGLRQLLILYIPLLITALILFIYDQRKNLVLPKIDVKAKSFKLLTVSFGTIIFAGIGYIINSKILSKFIKYQSFEKLHYLPFSFGKIETLINGVLDTFGYRANRLIFSKSALYLNMMSAILIGIVIISLIYIYKNRKKLNSGHIFVTMFYIVALITMFATVIFTDSWYQVRYLLPVTIFFVPVIGIFLTNMDRKFYKTAIILFVVVYAVTATWYYLLYTRKNNEKYKEFFDKRESVISTKSEDLIEIKNKLIENKCYNGYSSYWTANVLTELSDGEIDVWCFDGTNITEDIFKWLQLTRHSKEAPTGKIFLILNEKEKEKVEFKEYDKLNVIYNDKNRTVYTFDSKDELVSNLK